LNTGKHLAVIVPDISLRNYGALIKDKIRAHVGNTSARWPEATLQINANLPLIYLMTNIVIKNNSYARNITKEVIMGVLGRLLQVYKTGCKQCSGVFRNVRSSLNYKVLHVTTH